jgi:hypothetical protein
MLFEKRSKEGMVTKRDAGFQNGEGMLRKDLCLLVFIGSALCIPVFGQQDNTYLPSAFQLAGAVDEEIDPYATFTAFHADVPGDGSVLDDDNRIKMAGTVVSVDGRVFTLHTGSGTIEVNTLGLGYNPLDSMGLQRISPGDRVSVYGRLVSEGRRINADTILSMDRDVGGR